MNEPIEALRYAGHEKCRAVVLRFCGQNLIVETAEGSSEIALTALNVHCEKQQIYLINQIGNEHFVLHDERLLAALESAPAPAALKAQAQNTRLALAKQAHQKRLSAFVLLGAVTCLLAVLLLALDASVQAALSLVPVEAESFLGAQLLDKYESGNDLNKHSQSSLRVQAIGRKLVSQAGPTPYTFHFYVDDSSQLNAYALPGGHIIICSRLVDEANSDDELACVMGHEMGHVLSRHTLRALFRTASGVVGALLGEKDDTLTRLVGDLTDLKYNRDQEEQADRIGVKVAYDANYDPSAMITFFERLKKEESQNDMNALEFVSDHPMVDSRIRAIRSEIAKLARASLGNKGSAPAGLSR